MKQYYCFLEKFNNYFNRKIIMFSSLEDYKNASEDFFIPEDTHGAMLPFDFNPNDNVMTEIIANDVPFTPDYILILDNEANIVSRWFILEEKRNRQGQWVYSLRRDVIADHIDTLYDAPIFVQKGMLPDDDPMIFNSEGMNFNEIKKSETLLKDNTNCAWIVGYVARNVAPTDITITVPDENFVYNTMSDIATAMGISEANLASLLNFDGLNSNIAKFTNTIEFRWGYTEAYGWYRPHRYRSIFTADLSTLKTYSDETVLSWNKPLWNGTGWVFGANLQDEIISQKASILATMNTVTGRVYLTSNQLEILRNYLNKPVFYNGNYYELSLNIVGNEDDPRIGYSAYTSWPAIANAVNDAVSATPATAGEFINTGEMAIFTNSTNVYIQMKEISDESGLISGITSKISSSRRNLLNQVFDMFAIPFGSIQVNYYDGGYQSFITRPDSALTLASAIAKELDASCYDIQLLPYCPITDLEDGSTINIEQATEGKEYNFINKTNARIREVATNIYASVYPDAGSSTGYSFSASYTVVGMSASDILDEGYTESYGESYTSDATITKTDSGANCIIQVTGEYDIAGGGYCYVDIWYEIAGTQHYSVILWANKNSFSKNLAYSLSLKDSVKVESQCNKYRIVSPNYQGSFDFNVAKNGGKVSYFIADCTYRPYTPYIKISPSFEYLYGTNFGDCRGLICGGDFSLPRFTSAWESYELNNKNYQNIFNREIQNLDIEQGLAMRQQLITGALGVATAGIVGGASGAKVGGVYGAIAGAVIGTGASGVGMAVDTEILAQRQREARQLSIDKFNYQLGNIKALPYTLTKVGSFDINSKIWPFLEFYTCTDKEKEALESKIRYESMTVMRIGTLLEFMNFGGHANYFKGELIRNDNIAEDPHTLNAIYEEFLKGVYI